MYFSTPLDGLMFEKENFFKRSRIGNRVSAYCPWLAKPRLADAAFGLYRQGAAERPRFRTRPQGVDGRPSPVRMAAKREPGRAKPQ